ncbi:PLP-dependent aminotransferase family protein [Sporomusa acidovorans]|uniref:Histidinol-phosphate aminotransferase n=1 Tax=Sporomusa acidovorans (strain ATCC 49682 / DSM 3132 / Mol) TaxID=1123286 RepID=A0ABZ3IZQ7_SPOA4|nr:PLP-dependent aminotransferase family protein [Sporomusa acidovorans]OZC24227.1 2-aminoadipate transaminase [Sporomusa acidovorans DSM 3132]SDF56103.1 valine-pyruvate aminotransferase apoenzyme [Sporomusa acidovorans]
MDISNIFKQVVLTPKSPVPLYNQIAQVLTDNIQNGTLPAGTKLPPERELASLLQVSRTTAINAYRRLEEQGLIHTKVGSGTYVATLSSSTAPTAQTVPWSQLFTPCLNTQSSSIIRELVASAAADDTLSLAAGMPDPELYPLHDFNRLFGLQASRLNGADLGHIPTEGYTPLRQAVTTMLAAKGYAGKPENTMIVSGSQQGLYLVTKIFLEPGDYVIVESPTYLGAVQMFSAANARLLSLPSAAGLPLDLLEDYLIRYRPKLFYVMPTFQNPNGRVMPLEERRELLKLAAKHRLVIVEDDPYGELYYDKKPPLSLKALDPYGGVIALGTFSKMLFPGLRTGWVVAPETVINRFALKKQYIDLHSSNLSQCLLYDYLSAGLLQEHLAVVRAEYKKRRDFFAGALERYCSPLLNFYTPSGGFYFWCALNKGMLTRQLLHEATHTGVSFVPGEAFYADAAGSRELRLCFVTQPPARLLEAVKRLGKALQTVAANRPFPPKHPVFTPII